MDSDLILGQLLHHTTLFFAVYIIGLLLIACDKYIVMPKSTVFTQVFRKVITDKKKLTSISACSFRGIMNMQCIKKRKKKILLFMLLIFLCFLFFCIRTITY